MLKELIYPSALAAVTIWGKSVIVVRQFEDMRLEIGSGFNSINRRLDDMDRKLDSVEKNLDCVPRKLDSIVGTADLLTFRQRGLGNPLNENGLKVAH